jgi:hypothetical protein
MIGLLLLFACGDAGPTDVSVGAVTFPHPEGYKAGKVHGAEALDGGAGTCLACHREDSTAPTCASCHAAYPHPPGWLAGTTHGEGLAGPTGVVGQQACAKCHGVEGLQAPVCTSCHASYPHVPDWKLGGHHGQWVLSRGSATATCGSCHGPDLAGTTTTPSCTKCHAVYPHPEGWKDPAVHPKADLATCAACHGDGGTGGNAGVACSRCHASYPHPAGWEAGHIAVANQVGQGGCIACHADHTLAVAPSLPAASCGSGCHGGAK